MVRSRGLALHVTGVRSLTGACAPVSADQATDTG